MTPVDTHALKDSVLCPWRTKSAKHQERMCDRVSVAGPCRDVPKLGSRKTPCARPCTSQINSDGITQSDDAAELRENTEGGPAYTLNSSSAVHSIARVSLQVALRNSVSRNVKICSDDRFCNGVQSPRRCISERLAGSFLIFGRRSGSNEVPLYSLAFTVHTWRVL
jgi:hypothetical protein